MPILRVLVAMAGPSHGWAVGDLYECDEQAAERLVAAGRAEYVRPPSPSPVVETAMHEGGRERAIRPRGRAR